MDSADRARKKAWKEAERVRARAAFPLPDAALVDFFRWLDAELETHGCDHTRRLTRLWGVKRHLPIDGLLTWLDDNSGFCDCEVAANAGQHWRENRLRPVDA